MANLYNSFEDALKFAKTGNGCISRIAWIKDGEFATYIRVICPESTSSRIFPRLMHVSTFASYTQKDIGAEYHPDANDLFATDWICMETR